MNRATVGRQAASQKPAQPGDCLCLNCASPSTAFIVGSGRPGPFVASRRLSSRLVTDGEKCLQCDGDSSAVVVCPRVPACGRGRTRRRPAVQTLLVLVRAWRGTKGRRCAHGSPGIAAMAVPRHQAKQEIFAHGQQQQAREWRSVRSAWMVSTLDRTSYTPPRTQDQTKRAQDSRRCLAPRR